MSRVPPPSSSRSPSRAKVLVPSSNRTRAASPLKPSPSMASPARVRTKSTPQTPSKSLRRPSVQDEPPVPKTPVNIREAIALKRAEVKKAERASSSSRNGGAFDDVASLEDAPPTKAEEEHVDELGRWSVKETIERARSTAKIGVEGSINLSIRSLPCLPSALFEIHLGINPDPLKSVPIEPSIGTTVDTPATSRRGGPSWFEAQDLTVLKAWHNEIIEIQPEISLFGSLKTVDLHKNKLASLPESFADLSALTTLDLSQNSLTSLPTKIFALPNLITLNISHNAISALHFNAPFSKGSTLSGQSSAGSFFAPVVTYATAPLPKLLTLDASHNQLSASTIDHANARLPILLSKIDLSGNPLGDSPSLIRALGSLNNLKELRCETADISDNSFPSDLFPSSSLSIPFPNLRIFDLGQTKVTAEAIQGSLAGKVKQELNFDFTTEDPPARVLRVLVGKPVVKEPWELEAERKARMRTDRTVTSAEEEDGGVMGKSPPARKEVLKESWEVEAEQGLFTEGGRRRARAAAAVTPSPVPVPAPVTPSTPPRPKPNEGKKEVQREAWEIEAEQGLLTEGGRRRARAAAAAAEAAKTTDTLSALTRKQSSSGASLTNPQYYSEKTSTLTLPPSAAASKGHSRAFSHASSGWPPSRDLGIMDIALPTPTLPLAVITSQPFARSLKILTLSNRRLDVSLTLPIDSENELLPNLEELNLEGCGLRDTVPVSRQIHPGTGAITPPRANELLLPLLAKLFPNLQTLDLSDNALTAASLQTDTLSFLITGFTSASAKDAPQHHARKSLKHLRLRGNRLAEVGGFQGLAELFKGNRTVPEWKLEELDLRDNEIGRLPPELGLLPLDVFLVDGNVFRVPQRRVWEREGTKGLLSWLRGRIE